jgi:hypothetical protein
MTVSKSDAQNTTELLKELFKTHDFETEEHDNWVIPKGKEYAMKGYWYPDATESTGQLSIEVFINSEMIMVESYAGIGNTAVEKLKSAFSSFVYHAFPTLLMALWEKPSDEVTVESWQIGTEQYQCYRGKQGIINYDKEKALNIPAKYNERIQELIRNETLEKEYHWFTFFYANINGLENYIEVLRDNIKWRAGDKALSSLDWKRSNSYYAVRQFIILKKDS